MRTIQANGDRFTVVMDELDKLGEPITTEKIMVVGDDEYVVRKAVGYLENRGWLVSWKVQNTPLD